MWPRRLYLILLFGALGGLWMAAVELLEPGSALGGGFTPWAFAAAGAGTIFLLAERAERRALGEVGRQPSLPARRWLVPALGLVLFVAGLFVVAELFLRRQEASLRARAHEALRSAAELKVAEIETWRSERAHDVAMLTGDAAFVELATSWLRDGEPADARGEGLRQRLSATCPGRECESMALLDAVGRAVLTAGPREGAVRPAIPELAILRALGRPIWTDLRPTGDPAGGGPELALLVPLPAARPGTPAAQAVLQLTIDPEVSLFPLVRRWPTTSASAETALLRNDGDSVVFLSGLRHWSETGRRLRRPVDSPNLLAASAARGARGEIDALDYREVPVLGHIVEVAETPWLLVTKIDAAEVLEPVAGERRAGFALLAALSLILAAWLLQWWRHLVARWQLGEARRELSERLADRNAAEALRQANDAVLLIDGQGHVVLANDKAIELYGYPMSELVGLHVDAIGLLVCDEGFAPSARPEGCRGGKMFEAEHRRRDGSRFPVEVSVRPLDVDGQRFEQSIVRDISERRRVELELQRAEQRWKFALEGSGDGVLDCDFRSGEILRSLRCDELMGVDPGERLDFEAWKDRLHPADRHATVAALRAYLRGETPSFACEYRLRTREGRFRWLLDRGKVVERDADGRPLRMIGTLSDIHERKQFEQRLRLLSTVFEHSHEAIVITEPDGTIVSVNGAFERVTGFAAEEAIENTHALLHSGLQGPEFYADLRAALDTTGQWSGEIWNRRKSGELYPAWLSISAVVDAAGKVTHYVGMHADISERKAAEERVRFLAHHDALTGLPNRSLLRDRLEQAVLAARRSGRPLGVVFLDLDRFKPINDRFGHTIGDRLLVQLAERLQALLRDSDTIARIGGDEFVVLLTSLGAARDAEIVAAKLLAEVSRPFIVDGHELSIAASLGIAVFPDDGETEADLMRNADAAMYLAKADGDGCRRYAQPEVASGAVAAVELGAELRRALAENQLGLLFEPRFDLASRRLAGLEALVRWRHPQLGEVPPERLLAADSARPLLDAIGDWRLETACRVAGAWRREGRPPVPIAVGLSAAQLGAADLPDRLARWLFEAGLPATSLELELAVADLASSRGLAAEMVERLERLGLHFTLSEVGTGGVVLDDLHPLRWRRLRIAEALIREVAGSTASQTLVRAVIALGRALHLRVLAPGVDGEPQLGFLRHAGCDEVQGRLFGPPVEAAEACLLLAAEAPLADFVERRAATRRAGATSPPHLGS